MVNSKKIIVAVLIVVVVAVSFLAGGYVKEREYTQSRARRCDTLISFAADKIKNGDISDRDTIEALISNIYAAYNFCDNPDAANRLHDLWNTLIFESESYVDREEELLNQLENISRTIKTDH